ncbi:MAG: L-fucose:H+ symporter permease [Bacteroidota bacterium]
MKSLKSSIVSDENPQKEGDKNIYFLPIVLITGLFFLWGLAGILNAALIAHFQPVFQINRAEALLVETAFYLGYFIFAIPAGIFIQRFSYKNGVLVGLFIYFIGALLFIPAAKTLMFSSFLFALFVIATGLAFLETAANPYITILGKPEKATQRLNLAQSFNGLALVVGPWLAGALIFSEGKAVYPTEAEKQLAAEAVILPYLLIAASILVFGSLIYFTRMPEPEKTDAPIFSWSLLSNKEVIMAFLAILLYVGAQASIWGISIDFVMESIPGVSMEDATKYYLFAGTLLFVLGRFFGTYLLGMIEAPKLLAVYSVVAAMLCTLPLFLSGAWGVYAILLTNFFMSIMFPTIFSLGVEKLGESKKAGSSILIMGIVGGAIIPPMVGVLVDQYTISLSFLIPGLCFLYLSYFGIRKMAIT